VLGRALRRVLAQRRAAPSPGHFAAILWPFRGRRAGQFLGRTGLNGPGVRESAAAVRRAGLQVSSLCRGGFFTRADAAARRAAHGDNLAALEEAATLEADTLVLVSGGLVPGSRDLGPARRMIGDGIAALLPRAAELGVRLGVEPLHPMFCADRCAVHRLADALDLAGEFPARQVGVVIDSYHVWWDPRIGADIARAAGRITGYQVRLGGAAARGRPAGPGPSRRRVDRLPGADRAGAGRGRRRVRRGRNNERESVGCACGSGRSHG
jgi:hypothetical protein